MEFFLSDNVYDLYVNGLACNFTSPFIVLPLLHLRHVAFHIIAIWLIILLFRINKRMHSVTHCFFLVQSCAVHEFE